jgi:branched-chain amino acid transport system substrate-binding protein
LRPVKSKGRMIRGRRDIIVVRRKSLIIGAILAAALCARAAGADVLIGVAGPMTGKDAWFGAQLERGTELAGAHFNAAGGVLGERVELTTADDFCDPAQAVAAAKKLVSDGVVFVVGHYCSGASIPASEVYAAAGVLMISPGSSNPMLTELGRANAFRVINRDDANGVLIGNYMADHWPDEKIAILHDNTAYGKGLAEEVKKNLNRRGLREAIYQAYVPGQNNYGAEIDDLQAAEIAVVFMGGYHTEIALMARQARDRGYLVDKV